MHRIRGNEGYREMTGNGGERDEEREYRERKDCVARS